MLRADNTGRDYRRLVIEGYDRCAGAFNAQRALEASDALAPLVARLSDGARVLDLGCGAGVPVAQTLSDRFDVIGADMGTLHFWPESFDAVVSFYAIFHLPRDRQAGLFRGIHAWLRPGGCALLSVGRTSHAGYTEDFFGVEMYWSHFDAATYREMLLAAGFELIEERELHHGYRDDGAPVERHPLLLLRKRGA